jgi:type IV secretory pathway VirB4 component
VRRYATSADVASARLALADGGTGLSGEPIGRCAGGAAFVFDPFAAYAAGLVANPNVLVAGSIGTGKSTAVKMLLARALARGARAVVLDPKGEYSPLAAHCAGEVVAFGPGAGHGLSPFRGEGAADAAVAESIVSTVLERPLSEEERFALAGATEGDGDEGPLRRALERLRGQLVSREPSPERSIALALRRVCEGDLAGVCDGDGTRRETASLVVLDLSSVWGTDRFALSALVAIATARAIVDDPGRAGYLVIDEAWAVLADDATSKWLQGSWKLARTRATSHVLVLHRWSDAMSAAPAGSARRARVLGLLRDCDSALVMRQDHGELVTLREALGLSDAEGSALVGLGRGECLARFGRHRSLVRLAPNATDLALTDTDEAMRAAW